MSILRWTFHEVKLQWKNGLYILYLFINWFYILVLGYIPQEYKQLVATLLLLSDPTFLGMMFVGGILLLEKNQGIPKGIGVTPLGSVGYIIGKVFSLLVIALITGLCIMGVGEIQIGFYSVVSLIISGSLFTLLGIIIGSFAKGINHFICLIALFTIPFAIPLIIYLIVPTCPFLMWIPTTSTIYLLNNIGNSTFHLVYLMLWLIVTFTVTKKIVEQEIFIR